MRETPQRLRALERAFVVEEVRATTRHALRNRLAAVRNATYYLRRKVDETALPTEDPRVSRFFDLIDSEVTAAVQLLEPTLPIPTSTKPPVVNVSQILTDLASALTPPPGVRLEVPDPISAHAMIEPAELEFALFILVDNAFDAMDGRSGAVRVAIERQGEKVALTIDDDGAGFTEKMERLFEPSFSTKGREGFGLKIARRIGRRWAGNLELAAREGGGVRATLLLPRGPD